MKSEGGWPDESLALVGELICSRDCDDGRRSMREIRETCALVEGKNGRVKRWQRSTRDDRSDQSESGLDREAIMPCASCQKDERDER